MWDLLSKIFIHIIDKVSLNKMFFFILVLLIAWFAIPYDMAAYYIHPRILPEGIYWAFLFVFSTGIFLFLKTIYDHGLLFFRKWRTDRHWGKIYATLSPEEIDIVARLISNAPLDLNDSQAFNLVANRIIIRVRSSSMFNAYILEPSFREFILNRYQRDTLQRK